MLMNDRQTRTFTIRARVRDDDQDEEDDTFPATLSSDVPVDRGGYTETLSHRSGAVNLARAPLPLIEGHNSSSLNLGLVDNLRVENGKLKGNIKFGSSARAREIAADVRNRIVRSLSIGYSIDDYDSDGNGNIRATRWTPHEASVVSVPADTNAGFFRSRRMNDDNSGDDEGSLSRSQRQQQRRMANAELEAADVARNRATEIATLCQRHGMAHKTAEWLASGMSEAQVREQILEARGTDSRTITGPSTNDGIGFRGEHRAPLKSGAPIPHEELRKYSLLRAIRSQANQDRHSKHEAGFELECSRVLADHCDRAPKGLMVPDEVIFGTRSRYRGARTISTDSAGGGGGNIVALDFMADENIELLTNQPQVFELGARRLDGLVGNAAIPRMTAGSAVGWIGEDDDYGDTVPKWDHPVLTPHDLAGRVDITRRLLIQSTPAADELVRSDLALQISIGIDAAAITGPGTVHVPLGIMNTPGVGVVSLGANGLAPNWNALTQVIQGLASANALRGNLGWLTNGNVMGTLMRTPKIGSTFPTFLWESGGTPNEGMIAGFKARISNNVPSNLTKGSGSSLSALIFGNWSDLLVGMWRGIDVQVDPYSLSSTGGVRITAIQTCDLLFRHPQSFEVILDAITT